MNAAAAAQQGASKWIIRPDDPVLVTGATGFIGSKVVETLIRLGFTNLRCFVRPSANSAKLKALRQVAEGGAAIQFIHGNLLSREDCMAAAAGASVVYHLAAGTGEKSFPDAFMNSVVTTRNLLDACVRHQCVRRFVSISSFAVYSNRKKPSGRILDESAPVEERPELRGEAGASRARARGGSQAPAIRPRRRLRRARGPRR